MFNSKKPDPKQIATTKLIKAVFAEDLAGVRKALSEGAEVNYLLHRPNDITAFGWGAFYVATGLLGYAIVRSLTSSTKNIKEPTENDTILHAAVRLLSGDIKSDSSDIVFALINAGAKLDVKNGHWETPADIIPDGYVGVVTMKAVLTGGPIPDDEQKEVPDLLVHLAVQKGVPKL